MRRVEKSEEIIALLDNISEIQYRKDKKERGWPDEKESIKIYIIFHPDLKCPYCGSSAILEYGPECGGIRSLWCDNCSWIDDFDYAQDILGERETRAWQLRPEKMVMNPFLVCPLCGEQGMAEFLSDFGEVKIIACLRCSVIINDGVFESRGTIYNKVPKYGPLNEFKNYRED